MQVGYSYSEWYSFYPLTLLKNTGDKIQNFTKMVFN